MFFIRIGATSDAAQHNDFAIITQKIINPIKAMSEMLEAYDKEEILSEHGRYVRDCLKQGQTSIKDIGFDIHAFHGLTRTQAVEKLVLPLDQGGLNQINKNLFITPDDYKRLHPEFMYQDEGEAGINSTLIMMGCHNDCLFCFAGGRRRVVSLPYPILTQGKGLSFYNGENDTLHYYDSVCGATIASVLFFVDQHIPRSIKLARKCHTAGYSPLDPSAAYVKIALQQLHQGQFQGLNKYFSITFHFFRPEILNAILHKDLSALKTSVQCYIDMYKELFTSIGRDAIDVMVFRTTPEWYKDHNGAFAVIASIQYEIWNELRKIDAINEIISGKFFEGSIGWDAAKGTKTLFLLRTAETEDPSLLDFYQTLNIDTVVLNVFDPDNMIEYINCSS